MTFGQKVVRLKPFLPQKSGLARTAATALHVGLKVIRNEQQNKSKIGILNMNKTSKRETSEIDKTYGLIWDLSETLTIFLNMF